jgi:hypothetical protein
MIAVFFCASAAWATPVTLTGNPVQANYNPKLTLTDDVGEPGLAPHLDIYQVFFDSDDKGLSTDRYYMGLTVNDPNISRTGGPTAPPGLGKRTEWDCYFYDTDGNWLHEVQFYIWATKVSAYVDGDQLAPSQFSAVVASGLEISILKSAMPALNDVPTFQFVGVLQDNGTANDDEITGIVPEPATMTLLALGGLAMLRRRK